MLLVLQQLQTGLWSQWGKLGVREISGSAFISPVLETVEGEPGWAKRKGVVREGVET